VAKDVRSGHVGGKAVAGLTEQFANAAASLTPALDHIGHWLFAQPPVLRVAIACAALLLVFVVAFAPAPRRRSRRVFEILGTPVAPALTARRSVEPTETPLKPKGLRAPPRSRPAPNACTPSVAPGAQKPAAPVPNYRATILLRLEAAHDGDEIEAAHARVLEAYLTTILARLAPQLGVGPNTLGAQRLHLAAPQYRLVAEVLNLGDRIRVRAEMRERTGTEPLFRLRYQALPDEHDKILAELVSHILKHAA
jgi:hypothetical protein